MQPEAICHQDVVVLRLQVYELLLFHIYSSLYIRGVPLHTIQAIKHAFLLLFAESVASRTQVVLSILFLFMS